MITMVLRTLIIYLILIFVMRFMGKRQIGELQLSELIITLMLSELAILPISNISIPLTYAVIPVLTLLSVEIVVAFIGTKSNFIKKIFDGNPSIIIDKGTLNQNELSKLRLSIEELLSELRLKDIGRIEDVEYAILEQNGSLSVFPKQGSSSGGLSHPIITDGHINRYNLSKLGRDEKWLLKRLSIKKCSVDDVFLFNVDDDGNENLIRKLKK